MMLVEVCRGVCDADVGQAGPARLEVGENRVPLKVGGVLGATARLDPLPRRPSVVVMGRLGAILAIRLLWTAANFGHASVLPVTTVRRPRPLVKTSRKMRFLIPGEPFSGPSKLTGKSLLPNNSE